MFLDTTLLPSHKIYPDEPLLFVPFQIALTKLIYLPTGNATASQKELLLARDVLEIGVEYSIAVRDIPAYERYMSQLKCYYYDYK